MRGHTMTKSTNSDKDKCKIPQSINPHNPPANFTGHIEPEHVGGKRYWKCNDCGEESIVWTHEALYSEWMHDDDCPQGIL